MTPIVDLPGIGPHLARKLAEMDISTVEQFAATPSATLLEVPGLGARRIESLLEVARQSVKNAPKERPESPGPVVRVVKAKASQDAPEKVANTIIADEVAGPAAPMKAAKKTGEKKVGKGKAPKKAKGKIKALKKEVKTRMSKLARQIKKLAAVKKALKKKT